MERNVFFVFLLHATTTTVQQLRYNFHSDYFKQNGRDRALYKREKVGKKERTKEDKPNVKERDWKISIDSNR